MPPASSFSANFFKHWYSHDVLPLAVLIGGVAGGVGFFSYRAAHAPDVVWNSKRNPTPWNAIKDDEGVKLIQINVRRLATFDTSEHS